ncbi:hypothetical protein EXT51_10510 [Pectobacterium carotovorum subsp. carotovorum]|uniref:dsDNA nuclease domain-containing protein n=1 Tax=Pectobacterium carotovorum TaxID=554 RepID=UPI00202D3ED0|nr:dsDNA nuclease domain-containing protein [Pectobacterium carotovorum]MCL6329937.1 hypothetical protein [Pectobacterium carotovorum subsp. carotovorum]
MNHSEKIAADKTSLGFEFQDLVYIEKLIELRSGQTLGLELHDDIHVETAADDSSIEEILLIQVKHSVESGNITDRDIDLWKTIHNWLKLVPGLPNCRSLKFQLYTNKSLNNQEFVSLLKNSRANIQAIIDHIRKTNKEITESESQKKPEDSRNPLAKYVDSVSQSSDEELKFIFDRFEFHSDKSPIIARISSALRQLSIPDSRLEETRKHVIGAFKESKFSRIIEGEKVVITFDDFRVKMGFDRIVRSARSEPADFDQFVDIYYSYHRPDKLSFSHSRFYTQLKDIGINDEEIIDRGVEMMLADQFMDSLRDAGSFSSSDNSRLENKAVSDWQLLHNQSHRKTTESDEGLHQQASLDCYDKTMGSTLKAGDIELPRNLSCGKYTKLSNIPRIGWRKDWKERFEE